MLYDGLNVTSLRGLKLKPDKFTEEISQWVLDAKEIPEMQIHGVCVPDLVSSLPVLLSDLL